MRPVRHISIAFALPTACVRRCEPPIPGVTPSLISGWPNFALSRHAVRAGAFGIRSSLRLPQAGLALALGLGWLYHLKHSAGAISRPGRTRRCGTRLVDQHRPYPLSDIVGAAPSARPPIFTV